MDSPDVTNIQCQYSSIGYYVALLTTGTVFDINLGLSIGVLASSKIPERTVTR